MLITNYMTSAGACFHALQAQGSVVFFVVTLIDDVLLANEINLLAEPTGENLI